MTAVVLKRRGRRMVGGSVGLALLAAGACASGPRCAAEQPKPVVFVPAPRPEPIPLATRGPDLQLGTGASSFKLLEDGAQVPMLGKVGGFSFRSDELLLAVRARNINPEHVRIQVAYHEVEAPQKQLGRLTWDVDLAPN